jgi:TolB-like protein
LGEATDRDRGTPVAPAPGALTALLLELAAVPPAPEPPRPTLSPGALVGRFEVVREIARGAFGDVYEARDQELGRSVALKLILPGRDPRGETLSASEAEAVARLSHPNLVTLFDVGRWTGGPYLVFELLQGGTLEQRLLQGDLPVRETVHVAVEVARGLAHAHAEGVVHRDLKPANVFLAEDGKVKILDFGLAHALGRRRVSGGTPDYMAPEQWAEAPEDERTDVYALGVLLHRMLAGVHPFPAGEGRWSSGQPPAPRLEIAGFPDLGPLVARMLEPDPTDRPRDAREVLAILEPIEAALDGGSNPPVRLWRAWREVVRWLLPLSGAALLGAGVRLAWEAWGGAPPTPSIAVLPFADHSPTQDQEYFAIGVAEEIHAALARLEGLRLAGRASSFHFKGREADPREFGRKLGVTYLLEGRVRQAGSRLRISAEVTRVADGERVWGQTYERELTDVFVIQDQIARSVAEALQVRLLQPAATTGAAHRPANPEAYRRYLLGRRLLADHRATEAEAAVRNLEAAVRLDPDHAPSLAWLAFARWNRFNLGPPDPGQAGQPDFDDETQNTAALQAAEEVIAMAPELADGYWLRGLMRNSVSWDWAGSLADLTRASALSPGEARITVDHARALASTGRLTEALAMARQAAEADPLLPDVYRWLGVFESASGRPEAAVEIFGRGLEIAPDHVYLLRELATTLVVLGRWPEALEVAERNSIGWMRDMVRALAHHGMGHDAESREALGRLSMVGRDGKATPVYQVAQVHAWRGERDQAFRWLEKGLAVRDGGMPYLLYDPLLRGLRDDPRYAALARRMNLPAR